MNGFLSAGAGVAGFALALFLLERLFPLRRPTRPLAGRLLVNISYAALAFGMISLTVRPMAGAVLEWTGAIPFGLLHLPWVPGLVRPVLAFLLMDLTFYEWHRANHRIPFLWRFHSVHHVDPDLDVSTAFRFHFAELGLSSAFRVAQVGLIGPSLWAYAAYEIVFQASTLFHHSNLRLPIGLERPLNRVLVTPRMHGIHHSRVWKETNANYSSVLPWWDRLHRTLRLNIPQAEIVIGLPAYAAAEDNRLLRSLAAPFRKQRPYWRREDGTIPTRASVQGKDPGRLAE